MNFLLKTILFIAKDSNSDFKHPIPVKIRTDSPNRQLTPPRAVIDQNIQLQDLQKQAQFQQYQKPSQQQQQTTPQPHPVQQNQPSHQSQPKPQPQPQPQQKPQPQQNPQPQPQQKPQPQTQPQQQQKTQPQQQQKTQTQQQQKPQSQSQQKPQPQPQQQPQPEVHFQQPTSQEPKMGNSFGGSNKRHHQSNPETSDSTNAPTSEPIQTDPQPPQPPQPKVKNSQEKCDDIANELNRLEKLVSEFQGKMGDKNYLKLDEFLTICLLKLDEVERTDDKIHQLKKKLINYTHQLSEKLESRTRGEGDNKMEVSTSNDNETNSENPPSSKRPKSPAYDNETPEVNSEKNAETKNEPEMSNANMAETKATETPTEKNSQSNSEQLDNKKSLESKKNPVQPAN